MKIIYLLMLSVLPVVAQTPIERTLYNVTTQRVEVVVLRTNVTATATNVVLVPTIIEVTHYEPRTEWVSGIQKAASDSQFPWLTPLLGALGAIYAAWAEHRNSRKNKLVTELGQNFETAGEVIKAQPNGQALRDALIDAIKSSQVVAGVKEDAAKMAETKVDTKEAREDAASVIAASKPA